jgi:mannose-6-phosphate isomerase-like protein (cupin superfamily)
MTERVAKAFVLRPNEGRAIDLGGFNVSVKADADDTDGVFSLLEADEPPGFGPPLHIHHDAAETFYVLSGEYIIYLEEHEVACPAGSFIYIPAGMRHGFRVGAVASRKLNLYTPAAMMGYFDELSNAIRSGHVDDEHLSEIALRYGMEVVGPVRETYA